MEVPDVDHIDAVNAVLFDVMDEAVERDADAVERRPRLEPDLLLVDQLGLRSLDLARIVAVLELELGVDPFSELVPITTVRTVADLYRAYDPAGPAGRTGPAAALRSADATGAAASPRRDEVRRRRQARISAREQP
jgi:acyl carrier protein